MALGLAVKVGTGLSVIDKVGVDFEGLSELTSFYDQHSASAKECKSVVETKRQELETHEMQRHLEEAENDSEVKAKVGDGYSELLKFMAEHKKDWDPDAGKCQGLHRTEFNGDMFWMCDNCCAKAQPGTSVAIQKDAAEAAVAQARAPTEAEAPSKGPCGSCACAVL